MRVCSSINLSVLLGKSPFNIYIISIYIVLHQNLMKINGGIDANAYYFLFFYVLSIYFFGSVCLSVCVTVVLRSQPTNLGK